MRIGIDARELCGHPTGAGRYLAGLLAQWGADRRTHDHEFVLYAPDSLNIRLDTWCCRSRLVPGRPDVWWEQVRLPRAAGDDHLDAFFAPAYTAPLRLESPLVVAIHDLSFFAHPEWFTTREGVRRRSLTRRAALRAAAVLTISKFSKHELLDHLGVPAERIHVVPPGVTPPTGERTEAMDPRVLFVGSIFNRRHVPDLVRAVGALARSHPDVSLDIVGDNRTHPYEDLSRTIDAEGLAGRARWHAYVSDRELGDLYAQARVFAFLSEYEGLGLTPLEALAWGITPVLLDTPVARESCSDAAMYVPAGDLPATTRALERALFDRQVRAAIQAAAPAVLARYRWPRAARDTLAVIEALHSRRT